jgi:spermidine synthase
MNKKRIVFSLLFLAFAVLAYFNYPVFFKKAEKTSIENAQVFNANPKVVYSKTSKFGLVEVITNNEPGLFNLCENKNYNLVHSTFSNNDFTLLSSEYEQFATTSFCFTNDMQNVLLLGLGGGEFLGYLSHYFKSLKVDVVEINPAIISVVQEFRKLKPANTNFICSDAFKYLVDVDKKYDLIVSDIYFFKPNLSADYKNFFKRIKSKLNKGGVFVMNAFIPYIPKLVVKDLFANFAHVAALTTSMGYNVVFICYQEDLKSSINTMDELMLVAVEMQNKYHFRYPLTELVTKVVSIRKEDALFWIDKFPDLN